MMSIISGIIVGVIMFFLTLAAGRRFGERPLSRNARAVFAGSVIGVIAATAAKVPASVAMVFLFCLLAETIYLVAWWANEGSTIKELAIFGCIDLILALVASSAAARILDMTEIKWAIGIVRATPWIGFFLSMGFFIFNMICWREEINSEDFNPDDYLNGDEKLEDFKVKESIFKKFRRWWSYEEVC